MIYIGIDPGVAGGISALRTDGSIVFAVKMPATERDVLDVLAGANQDGARAALEFVRAMPGMGVASMFQFGRGYGALRMGLIAAAIPFIEVTPQTWQKALGCRTKGDKNVSKARAQELFPTLKVTHSLADSLLLAEYLRRLEVRA